MNWLCIGDIISGPGISAVRDYLQNVKKYDLIVANAENAAGGAGLTFEIAEKLLDYGVDVITSGNHIWQKKGFVERLCEEPDRLPILRPANYPGKPPGRGYKILRVEGYRVLVVNLEGRTFMENIDCPFKAVDEIFENVEYDLAIVDFHAEATSEKIIMGQYLAGRATVVFGTHTHVQTADEKLLQGRTAYITDLGMTGPENSVIGVRSELATRRMLTGRPVRFKVEKQGPRMINGLVVTVDEEAGRAVKVERLNKRMPERSY